MASTEASVLTVDSSDNSDSSDDLTSTDDPPVFCSKKDGPNSTIISCSRDFFSLLNSSFGESQEKALEDYVDASNMLQYN